MDRHNTTLRLGLGLTLTYATGAQCQRRGQGGSQRRRQTTVRMTASGGERTDTMNSHGTPKEGEEGIGRERREEMVSELRSRWTSGDEVTGAGPVSSRRAAASSRRAVASSRRRIESERDETTATASGGSGVGLGLGIGGGGPGGQHIYGRGGGGFVGWAACGLPH